MQDRGKFALGVIITMIITALVLRGINYYTKNGQAEINGKVFKVEIVKTPWEQEQGLSGRKSLAENKAMLFVFPQEDYYQFWMKGMNFSIDIIWINQGKIVDIKKNAPIPITQYLEQYRPDAPAKYILEIGAGLVEKYNFKVGDNVGLDI